MNWRLGHRPGLDGVRGLAIALVVLGHIRIPGFDGGGWTGVTLFFVLSGFLITLLLLEECATAGRISFGAFYRRRALRLLPALAVLLVVLLGWRLWAGEGNAWLDTAAVALYSANWLQILTGQGMGLAGHTWSLAVEEQYYLVWPLALVILIAMAAARPRIIVGIIVAGALVSVLLRLIMYVGPADYERVYMGTDTRADALLAGSALAAWFHFRGAWVPRWPMVFTAAAVLFLIGAPPAGNLQRELTLLGLPLAVLASTVLIASAATGSLRAMELGALRFAGKISYGLYLWHLPVIAWVVAALAAAGTVGLSARVIGALVAITVAVGSYRYIEQPFLRLRTPRKQRGALSAAAIGYQPALQVVPSESTAKG